MKKIVRQILEGQFEVTEDRFEKPAFALNPISFGQDE